ncbi:hypothetical protein HY045_01340 [Candidatus Woesebacteria bacterium]|nr:hypothetical protein [Candidatus Woesebacteria bacterium]
MTSEARILDVQAVEAAEFARKNGGVLLAAELAAVGLGLNGMPLYPEEVTEIAKDPRQCAVLACLARIYVDSLKSVANKAKFPYQAMPALLTASNAIKVIYRNPELNLALKDVATDHLGRPHHFLPEMKRDEAKTLFAASVLFGPSKSGELILLGERILLETYARLPNNHPTKPLIGIEAEFSKASRGKMPKLEVLKYDFQNLRKTDEETNPNRVATVASWFIAWGERLNNPEMSTIGYLTFNKIIKVHPEWAFMTDSERQKIAKQKMRKLIFRYLSPIITNQESRESLYINLKR